MCISSEVKDRDCPGQHLESKMLCVPNNLFRDLWETLWFVSSVVAVTAWQCPQGVGEGRLWLEQGCGWGRDQRRNTRKGSMPRDSGFPRCPLRSQPQCAWPRGPPASSWVSSHPCWQASPTPCLSGASPREQVEALWSCGPTHSLACIVSQRLGGHPLHQPSTDDWTVPVSYTCVDYLRAPPVVCRKAV